MTTCAQLQPAPLSYLLETGSTRSYQKHVNKSADYIMYTLYFSSLNFFFYKKINNFKIKLINNFQIKNSTINGYFSFDYKMLQYLLIKKKFAILLSFDCIRNLSQGVAILVNIIQKLESALFRDSVV